MEVDNRDVRIIFWFFSIFVFGALTHIPLWSETIRDRWEPGRVFVEVGIVAANAGSGAAGPSPLWALASAINECFEIVDGEDEESVVVLGFVLDETGQIAAPPRLLSPSRAGKAERRLFRAAWAAIEECQPFSGLTFTGLSIALAFETNGAAPPPTGFKESQAEGDPVWPTQPDAAEMLGAGRPFEGDVFADAVAPDEPAESVGEVLTEHTSTMVEGESTPDVRGPSAESVEDLGAGSTRTADLGSIAPELLSIVERGELTVRAMRAFGQLSAAQNQLVVALRQRDLDLLGASSKQLRAWVAPGGAGEGSFSPEQKADLQALLLDMESLESAVAPARTVGSDP